MKKENKKVRVVEIWGKFPEEGFVLEAACSDECMCEICKDAFWIKEIK